jgi:hypothetical protein
VDTGCGTSALDTAFARGAGVAAGDWELGSFAAGRTGPVRYGMVDELTLGGLRLARVPVQVHELGPVFAAFAPDTAVHGILGSDVLYRFRATLDLGGSGLTLAARAPRPPAPAPPPATATATAGDHDDAELWLAPGPTPLVSARINAAAPGLLFLDTGMAGADLGLPLATVQLAGVGVLGGEPRAGLGGGGPVHARSLRVDRVAIGRHAALGASGLLLDRFPVPHQLGFQVLGLAGAELLQGQRVTLDFDRMRLGMQG